MSTDSSRLAPIDEHAIYPLAEFEVRVGLTRHGVRSARRRGLRVRYVHGRCYVCGRDWLEYLNRCGTPAKEGGDDARSLGARDGEAGRTISL